MTALQTSVRYAADGESTLWPIPFPFGAPEHVGVKLIGEDGRERRLGMGTDYVLSGNCVLAVVPVGCSLCLWLDAPLEDALDGARQTALRSTVTAARTMGTAQAQPQTVQTVPAVPAVQTVQATPVAMPAAPVVVTEPATATATATTASASDAALREELKGIRRALAALQEEIAADDARLDAIQAQTQSAPDAQTDAQTEAAHAAAQAALDAAAQAATQADAALRRLADETAAGRELLAHEAATRKAALVAELETAAEGLRQSLETAAGGLTRERLALQTAQQEARRLESMSLTARQSVETAVTDATASVEEAVTAAREARQGAETARKGAETARNGAETAASEAATSARATELLRSQTAQDRQRAERAARDAASARDTSLGWSEASAASAEQAFGSAQCAWKAAWHASVAAQPERPGMAAYAAVPEIVNAVSGAYVFNPHLRRGPTVFMGVWPLRDMARGGGWDGVFFLGKPYPDSPTLPPEIPCPPPVRPDGNGGDGSGAATGVWKPCGGHAAP